MKKKLIIIFSLMIILIGGVYLKNVIDKNRLLATEGPRIEKYLNYNYLHIDSITFEKVIINPTGIPHIKGYLNNNKNMTFDAGIYEEHFNGSVNFFGKIKPQKKEPHKKLTPFDKIDDTRK